MMKKFYGIFILMIFVQFSFAQKVTDPRPISPEDGIEDIMPDVILDWSVAAGVGDISYHFQLATDESFSNLVVDEQDIEISAYYAYDLDFGGTYFWKVRAKDDNGFSEWSTAYSLTIFSEVAQDKPKDGKDELEIRTTIKWKKAVDGNALIGLSGYQIDVDTTEDFNSPYYVQYVAADEEFETLTKYQLFGEVHYWRIRPFHTNGTGVWSPIRTYETEFEVELKGPSNNATDQELDVPLEWKTLGTSDDIIEYYIEVSTTEDFAEPVVLTTTDDEVIPTFLKFDTQYWWRVKATHVNDETEWSETRTFTTIDQVVLEAPADGEVVNTIRPTLEWEALEDVNGYEILFSTNPDLSDANIYLVENAATDKYPLPALELDTDYYWTVRAYKTSDTTSWADQFHFNVPPNVGVNELTNLNGVNLYPNPVSTSLNVTFNVKNATELSWIITDILGQNVSSESVYVETGFFSKTINTAEMKNGVYFLEITQGKETQAFRFVVE